MTGGVPAAAISVPGNAEKCGRQPDRETEQGGFSRRERVPSFPPPLALDVDHGHGFRRVLFERM